MLDGMRSGSGSGHWVRSLGLGSYRQKTDGCDMLDDDEAEAVDATAAATNTVCQPGTAATSH